MGGGGEFKTGEENLRQNQRGSDVGDGDPGDAQPIQIGCRLFLGLQDVTYRCSPECLGAAFQEADKSKQAHFPPFLM